MPRIDLALLAHTVLALAVLAPLSDAQVQLTPTSVQPAPPAQPAGPGPVPPPPPVPAPVPVAITFTGILQKATLPSICQEETHYIECTGPIAGQEIGSVLVKSTTLNLDAFVGKPHRFTCVAAGVTCLIYDITSATPATAFLETCGTPAPGCPVRFRVGPTGVIGVYALFASGAPGFLPIDSVLGTAFLSQPVTLIASGTTFGATATVDVGIPPNASWIGTQLWFQGVRADVGPVGPPEATNPVCFTVLSSTVPCILPGC